MSTSAAINPKGARPAPPGSGPVHWVETYLNSSVGQKILVAFTGLSLVGFVVAHVIGNLKIFNGREALNHYAYFLKHDLGVLIWIARGGLLGVFLLHLTLTLRLKLRAAAARPIGYAYQRSAQASPASKTMVWTGIVIGSFVAFHLAHFTFGVVHGVESADGKTVANYLDLKYTMANGVETHDVYAMVISGFTTWWISAIYLACQVLLFVHLSHGIPSQFQTVGLVGRRFSPLVQAAGVSLALAVLAANAAIVFAVWFGYIK